MQQTVNLSYPYSRFESFPAHQIKLLQHLLHQPRHGLSVRLSFCLCHNGSHNFSEVFYDCACLTNRPTNQSFQLFFAHLRRQIRLQDFHFSFFFCRQVFASSFLYASIESLRCFTSFPIICNTFSSVASTFYHRTLQIS